MEKIGIELEQAVHMILGCGVKTTQTEILSVVEGNGRILAQDIYSPIDNPPFDRSPLDGFALRAKDTKGAAPDNLKTFQVVETIYAGGYSEREVQAFEAVRIMTGAPIPLGANCVIRQEDTSSLTGNSSVTQIGKELKEYDNYCFKGEDITKGKLLLPAGIPITYIEQGILSSVGISKISVYQKIKAAVFVTGDELAYPGGELKPGKIYDSNLQIICSRLCEYGLIPAIAKYLPDDAREVAKELKMAAKSVDFIITTGGVSVGDKDIFHEVLPLLEAKRLFWKVNIKPGTPAMFSLYQDTPMFHLSGNPFAAVTTFELLVRPFAAKISRDNKLAPKKTRGILKEAFTKTSSIRRVIRGRIENEMVSLPAAGKHSSGMLASMTGCNCLIDIPAGSGVLNKGCEVDIILL